MTCTRSRSFASTIAALALLAFSTFGAACVATVLKVHDGYDRAVRWADRFLSRVVASFAKATFRAPLRPVVLVQACAYALGLAKRQRPTIRQSWRMCPSA